MPAKYDAEQRTILLQTELHCEPVLTVAGLIHGLVADLLYQHKFGYAHFPELVDLATVAMGLAIPFCQVKLVDQGGSFWDSTAWDLFPRPFLNGQSASYALALSAWSREDQDVSWLDDLPVEFRKPTVKSHKFLVRTADTFVDLAPKTNLMASRSIADWMEATQSKSPTRKVIALRHLNFENPLSPEQQEVMIRNLRSGERAILLHTISATERLVNEGNAIDCPPIFDELKELVKHRDDEIRAKAIACLTRLQQLDEETVNAVATCLDTPARHVRFASIVALASLEAITPELIHAVDRSLLRALQTCDYELIEIHAMAYLGWIDDPRTHFVNLIESHSPEYLEIALETLETAGQRFVSLQ